MQNGIPKVREGKFFRKSQKNTGQDKKAGLCYTKESPWKKAFQEGNWTGCGNHPTAFGGRMSQKNCFEIENSILVQQKTLS